MAQNGHTENIHVLGASGFDVMPLFAHASKSIDNLTYDSSSYNRGVIERQWLLPMNLKLKMHFGTKDISETKGTVANTRLNSMPCNCPVCLSVKPEQMYEEGSWAGSLLSMHNLYWYLYYADTMKIMSQGNEDVFRGFVGSVCKDTAVLAMEIFDAKMANDDIEYDKLMLLASSGAQLKAKEISGSKADKAEALAKAADKTMGDWEELF
jgi:hypothetical protein